MGKKLIAMKHLTRLKKMLMTLDRVEITLAKQYGPEARPGSIRASNLKEAESLRAVITALEASHA